MNLAPRSSRGSFCFQPRYSRHNNPSAVIARLDPWRIGLVLVEAARRRAATVSRYSDTRCSVGLGTSSPAIRALCRPMTYQPVTDVSAVLPGDVAPAAFGGLDLHRVVDGPLSRLAKHRRLGHAVDFADRDHRQSLAVRSFLILAAVVEVAVLSWSLSRTSPAVANLFLVLARFVRVAASPWKAISAMAVAATLLSLQRPP